MQVLQLGASRMGFERSSCRSLVHPDEQFGAIRSGRAAASAGVREAGVATRFAD